MKNYLTLFFILVFIQFNFSQNLIPNGDFELYNCLPTKDGEIHCLEYWINPTASSPDFYNTHATGLTKSPSTYQAYIHPYSGDGFAGLYTSCLGCLSYQFREYLTSPLISALEIGEVYQLTFLYQMENIIKSTLVVYQVLV